MRKFAAVWWVLAVVGCGDNTSPSTGGPATIIDQAPPALGSSSHVSVTFHAEGDATAVFGCQLDGSGGSACTSPFAITVADGAHTISIAAANSAGEVGSAATASFTVDTTAPDTVITSAPTGVVMATSAAIAFAASPADPSATFQCSFDGAAFAACTSPTTVTGADGDHAFAVRATDAAGNPDPTPAMATWTISTTGPELAFTQKPPDPSNEKTPTFGFTSTDSSATFQCQVDGLTTFATCTSPVVTPSLADGSNTFEVRATDAAQNHTTITYTWTVDTVAPLVTITGGPTGTSNTATPTFTFTTSGGATGTTCAVDSGTAAACTSPVTTDTLAQGAHTFTVDATDAAGNTGSASQTFSVDTVSPTVTIVTGPSGPTNNPLPSWAFTTTDSPSAIDCAIDSGSGSACTSPFAVTTALPDGTHTFTVTVADGGGNQGSASRTINVDTVAPVVTITGGPTGTTQDAAPTFTFTVTGGAVSTQCRIDTGSFSACTASFTPAALGGGAHTFEVQATDAAGNTGDAKQTFTVDSNAPTLSITVAPPAQTNNPTPTIQFVVGATAVTVTCQLDSATPAACTSPVAISPALADGPHTFTVSACTALPACATDSRTFTVDTIAPVVTITSGPQDPTPTGAAAPAFGFTATGATTVTCRVRDAANPNPAFVACSNTFTSSALADGAHTFEVSAADDAGNTASATRAFTIDSTAPTLAIVAPLIAARTSLAQPAVFFAVSDASSVTTQCAVDTGAPVTCDGTAGFTAPAPLPEGPHAYHVTATDTVGNSSAVTASFTVDTTPPTVVINSGPANPTNDTSPTFTFTVGADAVTVTCAIDTGATISPCTSPVKFAAPLAPGSRTFTVTATDSASPANLGSASDTFFIGVCGDGSAQGTEACDGSDLEGKTCATFGGGFTGGTLKCSACAFDTSQCSICGDGTIGNGEVCDGSNIGSATCATAGSGFTAGDGTPVCNAACTAFTTSTCGTCGNGVIDGNEVCDPGNGSSVAADFGSNTCVTLGHAPGNLACNADCTLPDAATLAGSGSCDGGFIAASTGFSVGSGSAAVLPTLCDNAFSLGATIGLCTRDQGVWALASGSGAWVNVGNTASTTGALGTFNLRGHAIYVGVDNVNASATYVSNPATTGTNLWRTTGFSTGTTAWSNNQSGADAAAGSDSVSFPVQLYALHTTSSSLNLLAGWHPTLGALLQHGQTKKPVVAPIGSGITGTVTSIATNNGNGIPSGDLYVAVYGKNPGANDPSSDLETGSDGSGGGIYYACDMDQSSQYGVTGNGKFSPRNGSGTDQTDPAGQTHILDADKPLVFSITQTDFSYAGQVGAPQLTCAATGRTYFFATVWYVALRGGGQVYSTNDDGVTWTKNNAGLPAGAEVYHIAVNCNSDGGGSSATCSANNLLYAATSEGLYTATVVAGQPLQWALAGLEGKVVRSVMLINNTTTQPPTIYVGADDNTRIYMHSSP